MDEFALIREFFAPLGAPVGDGVVLGIGDDCALLQPPAGELLAVSTDSLVAGRHFPHGTRAFDIGWKALAVNLSDLAAMGATPRWFTLALSLEQADPVWLRGLAEGLHTLAQGFGIRLVGGDTTRGPLQVNLTVIGSRPQAGGMRRDGARVGDAICVSGSLGDAAVALRLMQQGLEPDPGLRQRLDRPVPRIRLGLAARGHAHAAIDLSDGLAGDLPHLLEASSVGAVIELPRLPASTGLRAAVPADADRWQLQLGGGDDYELCLCLPPAAIDPLATACDVPLTRIGTVVAGAGLRCVDVRGATIDIPAHGYRHFD